MNHTRNELKEDTIYLSDLAHLMELHNEIQALKNNILMQFISTENMIDTAPITKDMRCAFYTLIHSIKKNYEVF